MKRYEILDHLEAITDRNHAQFPGVNEANLFAREEMADFMLNEMVGMLEAMPPFTRDEILTIYYADDRTATILQVYDRKIQSLIATFSDEQPAN